MFSVGDYVEHRFGFRGYVEYIISETVIVLKRDDGVCGTQYTGCYITTPRNLTLILDSLENE